MYAASMPFFCSSGITSTLNTKDEINSDNQRRGCKGGQMPTHLCAVGRMKHGVGLLTSWQIVRIYSRSIPGSSR